MKFMKRDKRTKLEKEIDSLLDVMEDAEADSDEYTVMAKNLEILYKAKSNEKLQPCISPDTIAVVVGNLLGIVLILKYEELNFISSKALGFVIKGRV